MERDSHIRKCMTNCPKNCPKKFLVKPGVSEDIVRKISKDKDEPDWMLKIRLEALKLFNRADMPKWGPNLSALKLDKIVYYSVHEAKEEKSWDNVPLDIKSTFDSLGVIRAEKSHLSGSGAQFDSQMVYHNLKQEFKDKGIIFENMDVAVKKYPELVREYFMTRCVRISDHKFSMLHAAVWSGGTFIYVPKNVKVDMPLQAYFRLNAQKGGQFEHTIIVADEGSEIHYIEGCSAPLYKDKSLHAGCVELFVKKGAKVKYSSVENWARNMYNLNTKRAIVEEDGIIEWTNGNTGSGVTMLYPTSVLVGRGARSESLGIAFATSGQNQDTGTKVIHLASNTTSVIKAKSIVKGGGISSYRGLVKVSKSAKSVKSSVECDTLMVDDLSCSNTYPTIDCENSSAIIVHEAKVGKISDKEIYYLMSRGYSEDVAKQLIVSGFASPVIKKLPLEYAVELNKLIEMQMDSNLG